MLEAFLLKSLIAIILISISSSLLGVFVLWKRLAYFGDSLSHSILLGLVLGAIFEQNQMLMLVIFSIVFSIILGFCSHSRYFSKDTIIMILSYSCIALAVILNDIFLQDFQFTSYIFGDILTVGSQEIYALLLIMLTVIFYVILAFKKILLINVNRDFAAIEGVKTALWDISFLAITSLVIACSVQIVGIFLMTALLILPAAIARIFASSAKQMMILSLVISIITCLASFEIANIYDLSISSMVVVVFAAIFTVSLAINKLWINVKSQ